MDQVRTHSWEAPTLWPKPTIGQGIWSRNWFTGRGHDLTNNMSLIISVGVSTYHAQFPTTHIHYWACLHLAHHWFLSVQHRQSKYRLLRIDRWMSVCITRPKMAHTVPGIHAIKFQYQGCEAENLKRTLGRPTPGDDRIVTEFSDASVVFVFGIYCLTWRFKVTSWFPEVEPAYSRTWDAGTMCSVMLKNSVVDMLLCCAWLGQRQDLENMEVFKRRRYDRSVNIRARANGLGFYFPVGH